MSMKITFSSFSTRPIVAPERFKISLTSNDYHNKRNLKQIIIYYPAHNTRRWVMIGDSGPTVSPS